MNKKLGNVPLPPSLQSCSEGMCQFLFPDCLHTSSRNWGNADLQECPRWAQSPKSWFEIMPVIMHLWDDSHTHLPITQTSLSLFTAELSWPSRSAQLLLYIALHYHLTVWHIKILPFNYIFSSLRSRATSCKLYIFYCILGIQ